MSVLLAVSLTLLTPAFAAPRPKALLRETADPYCIVAAAAMPVLPEALRGALETRFEQILTVATVELLQTGADDASAARAAEHFILLDAAEPTGEWSKRLAAARSFPRDAAASAKLCAARGGPSCGSLPWTILSTYASLQDGFRTHDAAVVVRHSGALLHFVTDAVLPFHVTLNVEQGALGAPPESPKPSSSSWNPDRTLAWRCEAGVFPVLQDRFAYEVRVAPTRYGRIGDPAAATFSLLGDSYEALQAICDADAEITRSLAITDEESFAALRAGYYERFAARIAPALEGRLEAAALLLAGLIGTAWEDAGRPVLTDAVPAAAAAPPSPALERPADSAAAGFVGSRESTVFHKGTCPHTKRVNPSNLVRFDSAEAALAAGRTPCRACKPGPP